MDYIKPKAIILIDHQNFKQLSSEKYSLKKIINFFQKDYTITETLFYGSANNTHAIEKEIKKYKPPQVKITPIPCESTKKMNHTTKKPEWVNSADFKIYLKAGEILHNPKYKQTKTIILISSDKDFYWIIKETNKKTNKNITIVTYSSPHNSPGTSYEYIEKATQQNAKIIYYKEQIEKQTI